MVTIVGIMVLLIMTFIGATGYLHYMGWLDVRDYFHDLCFSFFTFY